MNREALEALRERVEAGAFDFDWGFAASPSRKALPEQWHNAMNAYLGSLDAALALHDALLPGWKIACIRQGGEGDTTYHDCNAGDWFVNLRTKDFDAVIWESGDRTTTDIVSGKMCHAWSANPARAWLLAILSALIAQTEEGE